MGEIFESKGGKQTMKAAVYYKYGSPDVISVVEIEKPLPKQGEVLVQVKAASINSYDCRLLQEKPSSLEHCQDY